MSHAYIKRPLRVAAFQYLGNRPNSWPRWARRITVTNREEFQSIKSQDPTASVLIPASDKENKRGTEFLVVRTWAGGNKESHAHIGDYVVREPNGVIRVYTQARFKAIHEPLPLVDMDIGVAEIPDCVDLYGDYMGFLGDEVGEQQFPVEDIADIQKPDDPGGVQEPDPESPYVDDNSV